MHADRPASTRGEMIELQIDEKRFRTLAPLHQETALSGPDGKAVVFAPAQEPYQSVTAPFLDAFAQHTGVALERMDDTEFDPVAGLGRHAVAIGHAGCNRLLGRMLDLGQLTSSDVQPGEHRLVSIHNPLGDGYNVVAITGASPEMAARGCARLLEHVVQREGTWLLPQRLFDVYPQPQTSDPSTLLGHSGGLDPAAFGGRPSRFLTALDTLNAGGEERWARAFIELVRPFATGEIPLSFALMSAVDFWTDRLVIGWDRAEEFPYFTDQERLLILNFLASCTEYCHDSITFQKWCITEQQHQIFNHHTFPAKGLFCGAMYLRRHGYDLPCLNDWLDKSARVFARAAQAGRSFDEGGAGYSWLVGNHLLEVSLAGGDTDYARSPKLRSYADLAVVIQNNRFELVPFGDCAAYHTCGGGGAANILLKAAAWHADAGFKWVAEQTAPAAAAADVFTRDLAGVPPARHLGLFVLPLDPVIHRWADRPFFPNYPPPRRTTNVPASDSFDKISFRGDWAPDADYLLLQGFGSGCHGHPDANAISQYQVRGRILLADCDYIRRMPKNHNMVMVIRDGQHDHVPITARLDLAAEFAGGAVTQSTLLDDNGCDWTRTLIWLNGDCVLVVDSLTARIEADYELRCYWRTLGSAELTADGMRANHAGEHFHVIELTDSARRLDVEPPPLSALDYPPYNFGDSKPNVLCESQKLHLTVGRQRCFVNLLLPNGPTDEPQRRVRWDGQNRVRLTGEGLALDLGRKNLRIGTEVEIELPVELPLDKAAGEPARAATPQAAPVPCRRLLPKYEVALPATATDLAPLPDSGVLVGSEDGHIVLVSRTGISNTIARVPERVAAVLAGRLFGEEQITVLATGRDTMLHAMHRDGTERFAVPLPPSAHMSPAGTALCLADLDGDGTLWPVVGTEAWRVHAVSPEGTLRWSFATAAHSVTCLAAADLNGDGRDEIVAGTVYFCVPAITADGNRLWSDEDYNDYWRAGPMFPFVQVADVDADGELEVVAAGHDSLIHCIDCRGEQKWTRSIGDDPAGLVVLGNRVLAASRTGEVHCLNGAGDRIWRADAGAPCVALASAGQGLVCVATEDAQLVWITRQQGMVTAQANLQTPAHILLGLGQDLLWAAGGGNILYGFTLPEGV